MNCKTANDISLPDLLESLGFKKLKLHRNKQEAFFENPIREEKKPSFSVNLVKNNWYDFGMGKGGKVVDLVIERERTDVKGALGWLRDNLNNLDATLEKNKVIKKEFVPPPPRFTFRRSRPIFSYALKDYLTKRRIDLNIAKTHLNEIRYYDEEEEKEFFSLGIKNDSGGYALRNSIGHVVIAPHDIKYIPTNSKTDTVLVFEGTFDFLSYLMIKGTSVPGDDIIILNTLSHIKKAAALIGRMEHINKIISFLDNPRDNDRSKENMARAMAVLTKLGKNLSCANETYSAFGDLCEFWMRTGSKETLVISPVI